jgi:hypothetical protein
MNTPFYPFDASSGVVLWIAGGIVLLMVAWVLGHYLREDFAESEFHQQMKEIEDAMTAESAARRYLTGNPHASAYRIDGDVTRTTGPRRVGARRSPRH